MTTPIETAEQARRERFSTVKRLRVLATSDPGRGDEFANALVRLTGARLLVLDLPDAASDAPESVLLAARILARNGAAGPYTSPADATRFFTASAQLAAVQAGLGQEDAAARTLAGVDGWLLQLGRLQLREHLDATAVIWSLVARARSLLATDVPRANACADAAAHRLYAAGLDASPDYLPVAVQLLLADCRWAAGLPDQALAHHRLALSAYRSAVGGAGGRLRPGVAHVAIAPVVTLHEPYAQRLEHAGDPDLAVAVRRDELTRLEELGASSVLLASAGASLARLLARQGRGDEAETMRVEASALAPGMQGATAPGERCSWTRLSPTEALAPDGLPEAAALRLQQAVQAAVFDGVAARLAAQRGEAELRAAAEAAAADRAAEREQAERQSAAESEAARAAAGEQHRREAEAADARRGAEEAAARAAADDRRRRLAEEHQQGLAIDPAAAEAAAAELATARDRVRQAGDDLKELRDAQERLIWILRPLAAVDPGAHRAELASGLEALVGLRWRLGDSDGSREAAREARTLPADSGH